MSRAFVREDDRETDEEIERPVSDLPNYVTPRGLRLLSEQHQALFAERQTLAGRDEDIAAKNRLKHVERELRYAETRLQSAILVDPAGQSHSDIRFGATVDLADEDGNNHTFTIVGEDEACAPRGLIAWVSPLARALLGRRIGDTVLWERPMGDMELDIVDFRYADA